MMYLECGVHAHFFTAGISATSVSDIYFGVFLPTFLQAEWGTELKDQFRN